MSKNGEKNKALIKHLLDMEKTATQAELDRLEEFFIYKYQPCYNTDYQHKEGKNIAIVRKGEEIVNESLIVKIGEITVKDEESIFLPDDTIWSVKCPPKCPDWLKTQIKNVTHEISVGNILRISRGRFSWYNTPIKSNKLIKILAIGTCESDLEIYYANRPADFYNISNAVFAKVIRDWGSDPYEIQEHLFEEDINKDIQKAEKIYKLRDLLKGMEIANINSWDVKEISVEGKIMKVKLKNGTEKILNIR